LKIALGSDHGGFELKEAIKNYLKERGIEYIDFGTDSTDSVDYPEFAEKVSKAVISGDGTKGILCCGTGIGISIAANKIPGIRCAVVSDTYSAQMSREHNNANVLALGGRVVGVGLALHIVEVWLNTEFSGGRHQNRINLITDIENKYSR
jgi:ribose 5-phosphate isomerase B